MQKERKLKLIAIIFTILLSCLSLLIVPKADLFKTLTWLCLLLLGWWNIISYLISFYVEFFMGTFSLSQTRELIRRHFHFNLKFEKPLPLVLLPLILVIIINLLLWSYFHYRPTGIDWGFALGGILFAPFIEEYLFRQLFFDDLLLKRIGGSLQFPNSDISILVARFWSFVALIFQSVIFAYMHEDITNNPFAFWSRFAIGLLCGILYITSKKNLLPGISAHTTSNLSVLIATLINNLH